jgi:hypothetical protein
LARSPGLTGAPHLLSIRSLAFPQAGCVLTERPRALTAASRLLTTTPWLLTAAPRLLIGVPRVLVTTSQLLTGGPRPLTTSPRLLSVAFALLTRNRLRADHGFSGPDHRLTGADRAFSVASGPTSAAAGAHGWPATDAQSPDNHLAQSWHSCPTAGGVGAPLRAVNVASPKAAINRME